MLTVTAVAGDPKHLETDLLVVPVFKGGIEGPGAGSALAALGLDGFPVTPSFRGDIGQHLLLAAPGLRAGGIVLVGLGRMDEADPQRLRRAAAVAAQACASAPHIATTLTEVNANRASVEAVTEGFALGAHRDLRFKSAPDGERPRLAEVTLLVPSRLLAEARAGIERATVYAGAACSARDLVNTPPDRKQPAALAAAVRTLTAGACEVRVLDEDALAQQGFGGLLAVGGGSASPPCLVELRYRPASPTDHVVLIGEGVTFDAGGLNLKRGTGMATQKKRMAGAAAVAAVMSALARLDVRLQVTGVLPLAENVPGAGAQRPGDVVTVHGGRRVEVRDTDAEGLLLLADALNYAMTLKPQTIVDIATLSPTPAALGRYAGALMGNDDALLDDLRAAARVAGEPLWPLPLWPELERFLDSPVADVADVAASDGPGGATILAGLFLRRFVADCSWAHLDITGPSFLPKEPASGHHLAGATGYAVRTLLAWLQRRAV